MISYVNGLTGTLKWPLVKKKKINVQYLNSTYGTDFFIM